MLRFIRLAGITAIIVWLHGCANWSSIHHEFNLSDKAKSTKAITIDVKQRAIFSSVVGGQSVICAEPSPDALSVLAAGASGSLNLGGKALDLAGSTSETGSFIGNRTVTIQLLRDNLYRACEAYMSGGLTKGEFYELQRRYQIMTMGLLAIEQLTEIARPGSVTITAGAASANNASPEKLATAREAVAKAAAKQTIASTAKDAASTAKDDAQKTLDQATADGSDAKKISEGQAELDKKIKALEQAQTTLAQSNKMLELLTQEYEESKGQSGLITKVTGGKLLSSLPTDDTRQAFSDRMAAISLVARTTKQIVSLIVTEAFEQEACMGTKGETGASENPACRRLVMAYMRQALDTCTKGSPDNPDNTEIKKCAESYLKPIGIPLDQVPKDALLAIAEKNIPVTPSSTGASRPTADAKARANFLRAVAPAPTLQQIRVDVFAVAGDENLAANQNKIVTKLVELDAGDVRKRTVSLNDCLKKFGYVSSSAATIKYDDDQAETTALPDLRQAVTSALGVDSSKVATATVSVANATPLYMSVFLCQK